MPKIVCAQAEFGNAIGNHLSTSSIMLNPASAARMKALWMISPITVNTSLYNNTASLNMPFSPYRFINNSMPNDYKKADGTVAFNPNWIRINENISKFYLVNINRVQGPSVLVKKKNWVFGIRQEFITHTTVYGLQTKWMNEQLNALQNKQSSNDAINGFSLNDQHNIYFTHHRFNTINLLLSRHFKLVKNQELSLGVTYKLISPLNGYHFSFKTEEFIQNNINNQYAQIKLMTYYQKNPKMLPRGIGGLDIGAQWIYQKPLGKRKPNYKFYHPEYQLKIGVSLIDLGHLVYSRTIQNQMSVAGNFNKLNLDELRQSPNMGQQNTISQHFKSLFTMETIYGEKMKIGLPSRLIVNSDYQLYKNLFVNGLVVLNLRNKNSISQMSSQGFFQADIRYETRNIEFGIPIMYRSLSPKINTGFHFRFYHFFIGTNQIKSHFKAHKTAETSLYVGFELSNYVGRFIKRKYTYMKTKKKSCSIF
jgi:hypothetical protein